MIPIDMYHRKIAIRKVIDGDTVEVLIDLGFRTLAWHRVRLLGVESPELFSGDNREAGRAARDWVINWNTTHQHPPFSAWPYIMRSEKADSFGRYLGDITCPEGHTLNDDIIAAGHAVVYEK